jgi:protein-disulfide isomerase/plastocyanin
MEQKQIDEEDSYGEEFIDDEVAKKSSGKKVKKISNKKEPKKKSVDVKIEPVIKEEKKEQKKEEPVEQETSSFNFWKITAVVAIILLIVSVFSGFSFNSSEISVKEAEQTVRNYVNNNLLQAPYTADIVSSEEMDNIYLVTLNVVGQELDTYITKDGKIFFPQGFVIETNTPTEIVEVSAADGMVKGDLNAPITIIEFSEYQCPYCAMYVEETYPLILENYVETGMVKYVFRNVPLDFHPNAQKAAEAAECAGVQGKFWEMHDLLFANQDNLAIENLKGYAQELGLNMDQFNICLDNNEMEEKVLNDIKDAQAYGVSGTPTFFINGEMLEGAQPYEAFETVINSLLGAEVIIEEPVEEVIVEEPVEEVIIEEPVEEPIVTGTVKEINMIAKKWLFEPTQIEVNQGDNVRINLVAEGLKFTFSIPGLSVEEEIDGSAVIEFTASETGNFEYKCSSCEDWRGMKGTLKVN